MDNGVEQHAMAERLKRKVKRNISVRVARRKLQRLNRELSDSHEEVDQPETDDPELRSFGGPPHFDESLGTRRTAPVIVFPTPSDSVNLVDLPIQINDRSPEGTHQVHNHDTNILPAPSQSDFEPSLLMSYLDYAFPVLFPFYQPSILEGGRAWLLTLALKYTAFYHNIVGLAAYFYCAVPVLPGPEHDACALKAQTELQIQMEKAVQGVQDSLRSVTHAGIHNSLSENIRLLGNIVQFVNFEVAFASSENWQIHLTAAVNLFVQTLTHFGFGQDGKSMLITMLKKLRSDVLMNCSVWSAEQAALRFFSSLVIYQEIIAGTVQDKVPRLIHHYDELLVTSHTSEKSDLLKLEDFVGCQTWVLRSIAEIASLNEWKKSSKQAGSLDIMDLVQRANAIQEVLRTGIAKLNNAAASPPLQVPSPYRPLETILAKSNIAHGPGPSQAEDHCTISRIWAHAAQVYLIVVLSGWQPSNLQLRSHVAQALEILRTIDNPSWLRTLAWPFCVTGCLATEEQEPAFRSVANASSGLAMFGTLRDALAIMEKVWSQRYQQDPDTWDIASCLHILGHSVLLV